MLLLFVGGVMNLWWLSVLTIFVVLEKLTAQWSQGTRLSGVLLLAAGVWILRHGTMV
jgi:predicted metal-binding membrane protein